MAELWPWPLLNQGVSALAFPFWNELHGLWIAAIGSSTGYEVAGLHNRRLFATLGHNRLKKVTSVQCSAPP